MPAAIDANERCLNLIAYLDERRGVGVSLSDVVNHVPGYDDPPVPREPTGDVTPRGRAWESVRKKLKRDIDDISERLRIDIAYNETDGRYRIADPFFSPPERNALVAAAALIELDGFHPTDPGGIGQMVGDLGAQIRVNLDEWFSPLCAAIEDRIPVRIRYDGRERVVEPWFLGRWRTAWYLVAGDPDHDHAMRRFRLDRFDLSGDGPLFPASGEPGSYDIPDDVNPEEALDLDPNAWGPDPVTVVTVRVALDHEYAFVQEFDPEITDRAADHVVAEVPVRHREAFLIRILAFRGRAVVVGPDDVRAEFRTHLSTLAGGA